MTRKNGNIHDRSDDHSAFTIDLARGPGLEPGSAAPKFEDWTLPKLTKSLKTSHFRRVSGQVGLPKFTNTYHLNRKQNGNIFCSVGKTMLAKRIPSHFELSI